MNIEVYSASRHSQSASEAPASVTVITADEIQAYGYRSLADILRSVRSFYVTYDRNYSYVGARGFLRPGDYNTRVLLMIDGHRVNDNIYNQAPIGSDLPLDVDLIQRIEIIRGPSSSLYGTNAFFGVINIITRKASDLEGWEFSFQPSSFDTYTGRTSYGGTWNGVETLLSATLSDSGGQDLFFSSFNTPQTNNGIAHGTDYNRYQDLLATIRYRDFTVQAVHGSMIKGIPTGAYGTEFNNPVTRTRDQHQYLDLSYRHQFGRSWQLLARTFYDRYGYDGTWAYPNMAVNIDYVRGQGWGNELQWSVEWLRNHRLTFGGEFRHEFQQDQKNYDASPFVSYIDDRRSSLMGALYAEDEYRISSKWKLNAGFRHDRYTQYGGSTNPRAALIYQPFGKTTLKVLYGSAFRIPNAFEAHYGGGGNSDFKINPYLKPERTRNFEALWEQGFGKKLLMSVGAFHTLNRDGIVQATDSADGLYIFRNIETSHSTGTEFQLEGELAPRLTGRLSYTFTEAEDGTNEVLLFNSPQHLAKVNITAPLIQHRLVAGLDAQYESRRTTLAGDRIGGFPIFNLTLSSPKLFEHVQLSGSVYNLLNRKYRLPVGDEVSQGALPQDGRSMQLKLTIHF